MWSPKRKHTQPRHRHWKELNERDLRTISVRKPHTHIEQTQNKHYLWIDEWLGSRCFGIIETNNSVIPHIGTMYCNLKGGSSDCSTAISE